MYSVRDDTLWCRVSPFGNPRINVCLQTNRGLSHATTSFIASYRLGIHHIRLVTWFYNLEQSMSLLYNPINLSPLIIIANNQDNHQSNDFYFVTFESGLLIGLIIIRLKYHLVSLKPCYETLMTFFKQHPCLINSSVTRLVRFIASLTRKLNPL